MISRDIPPGGPVAAGAWLSPRASMLGIVRPNLPPAALEERVKDVLRFAGWREPSADRVGSFEYDADSLQWVEHGPDETGARWKRLAEGEPPPLLYWHRQSPQRMNPVGVNRIVRFNDPPLTVSGMANVVLDPSGRLNTFLAIPPQVEKKNPHEGPAEPDWSRLFSAAGLELAAFTETPPRWTPPAYAESRRAWEGAYPSRPEIPLRVEAATYRGRAVYFQLVGPWTSPDRMQPLDPGKQFRIAQTLSVLWVSCVLVGAILLARRHVKQGRGDRRGAFRVALYILVVGALHGVLAAHHADTAMGEWSLVALTLARALFNGGLVGLTYLALEPIIRRRWPDGIISWTRLLGGRLRDPRIGRDLVIGAAAGSVLQLAVRARYPISEALGLPLPMPVLESLAPLEGIRSTLVMLLGTQLSVLTVSMILFFLMCMSRMGSSMTAQRAGVLVFLAIGSLMSYLSLPGGAVWMNLVVAVGIMVVTTLMILKLGLLALMSATFFSAWPGPLTADPSLYYTAASVAAALLPIGVAVWGFWLSVGGRPFAKEGGWAVTGQRDIPGAAAR